MIPELDKIKEHLSFEILKYEVVSYRVNLTVLKNGEELVFSFCNMTDIKTSISEIEKHIKLGTLSITTEKNILKTMNETKSNWLLLDSNFNFIQCMTDKDFNPTCKQAETDFIRNKEKWAVAERVNDKLIRFVDNNKISDYREEVSEQYSQKTYLHKEETFVYIPKNTAKMFVESEMMYLWQRDRNSNVFRQHLKYNKSWAY